MFLLSKVFKSLIINPFVDRFVEGGPFFMSLILICLLLSIFFLIKGFVSVNKNLVYSKKMLRLVADSSLLGLVLGFLGSIIGLIEAFDSIEGFTENLSPAMIAGGLKVSFLTTAFGCFVFIISRIGMLVLKGFTKE